MTYVGWVTPWSVPKRQHISIAWQSNLLFKHCKGQEIVFESMGKERQKRKTLVQTITTRKLNEKNEVLVLGGTLNMSIACHITYQLHTGQAPWGNPICLEEVTKKVEPGKQSDVPC